MIKFLTDLLKGIIGTPGINSAKLKDAIWNTFARGFEVIPGGDPGGKTTFKVSDRVVGEYDGAIEAGLAEPADGPAIRKFIIMAAGLLWNALYKEEQE